MSKETVLTKVMVQKFGRDPESVNLNDFTAIDDEAAEALANQKGPLELSGIVSLSDESAVALAKHEGEIDLEGLQNASDEAILILHKAGNVRLGDLGRGSRALPEAIPETAIEFALAQILSGDDEEGVLYLQGSRVGAPLFGDLDSQQAELLSNYDGFSVCLNGWYTVESLGVLETLQKGRFRSLSIRVDEVTPEMASILVGFQALSLLIESGAFDEKAAELLRSYPNELRVNLKNVSEESREILSQHPSMKNWGNVFGPKVTAICGYCGNKREFELERDSGDGFEGLESCLGREDWQYGWTAALCDACKSEEEESSEEDESED